MSEKKVRRGGVDRQHGQQTRVHSGPSGLGRGRSVHDADSYRRRAEVVMPDRHEAVAYLARPQAAIGAEEDSTHTFATTPWSMVASLSATGSWSRTWVPPRPQPPISTTATSRARLASSVRAIGSSRRSPSAVTPGSCWSPLVITRPGSAANQPSHAVRCRAAARLLRHDPAAPIEPRRRPASQPSAAHDRHLPATRR